MVRGIASQASWAVDLDAPGVDEVATDCGVHRLPSAAKRKTSLLTGLRLQAFSDDPRILVTMSRRPWKLVKY